MRASRLFGGTLVVWLVFLASEAYPWGFAVHAHLAHQLNKRNDARDLNEMYGAMAPDMFNFRFDLPDVIAKAQDLLQADPSLLWFVDEPTALELTHVFVEYGLEVITKRMDPEIGQKITRAAFYRSPRFPSMLTEAFAQSFAPLFGNDPDLAEQVIISNEAEFRQQTILYGQLLTLDEAALIWALSEQLAQFTDAYGIELPPGVDPAVVAHGYLQLAIQLCQDDFPTELHATFVYLEAAMAAHDVGNRQ